MSLLILQIIIKQWDKSQRTETHTQLRAAIPDRYPLIFPPAYYAFNQQCVIDQQGDDLQGNRLKYSNPTHDTLLFDRFQICLTSNRLTYLGEKSTGLPHEIGNFANQWLQCRYNWRYSIFEADRYYWLYEEVTLNTIRLNKLDTLVFLNTNPAVIYQDISDLNSLNKPL